MHLIRNGIKMLALTGALAIGPKASYSRAIVRENQGQVKALALKASASKALSMTTDTTSFTTVCKEDTAPKIVAHAAKSKTIKKVFKKLPIKVHQGLQKQVKTIARHH